jgi:hypothetical protein
VETRIGSACDMLAEGNSVRICPVPGRRLALEGKPLLMRKFLLVATIAVGVGLAAGAGAQVLPTATGRNYSLSDPAWKLFIPDTYVQRGHVADLVVHFHGDYQTVWNNAKYANLNTIILTAQYGSLSSAYQTPFANNTNLFNTILSEALTKVQQQPDFADDLNWDKVAVSSFSAGYAAVREILKQPTYVSRINSMLLADTIYASFTSSSDHTPLDSQMVDFRSYAQSAKNGTKTLILTHSQVPTYTYSNTIETADDIMSYTNVTPITDSSVGLGGIQFYRFAHSGNFTVHGALGTDGDAHLLHLQYDGQWLSQLPLAHVPEPGGIALGVAVIMLGGRRRAKRE